MKTNQAATTTRLPMAASLQVPGYQIFERITEGECAEIYRALDIDHQQRKVVLKILSPRNFGRKAEKKRLIREGRLGLSLPEHPNIIRTLKAGVHNEVPYIVLESVEGVTLRDLIRAKKKLSDARVVELAAAFGEALRFLHSRKIFHKDVKPENVMWDGPKIKLLDFGLAIKTGGWGFWRNFFPSLEGSPAYLAPEYIRSKRATVRSDIYALGCTLYEAATGRLPFIASSDNEMLSLQVDLRRRPDSIPTLNPRLSTFTERLIMTALAKNPAVRYPSAESFLVELARNPQKTKSSAYGIPGLGSG